MIFSKGAALFVTYFSACPFDRLFDHYNWNGGQVNFSAVIQDSLNNEYLIGQLVCRSFNQRHILEFC